MCGIVGYIGSQDAQEILLKGLEKLEYRGYDSAGIALAHNNGIAISKEKGRIADLRKIVDAPGLASVGIGHTRWATHGAPSRLNAHPHQSSSGRFTIVHNGVIENEAELKRDYLSNVTLQSDTDTEAIVQLVERFVNEGNSTEEAFRLTLQLLHGSYALALLDAADTETIYVAKNKSPLLVGLGKDGNVIASDAAAMLHMTDRFLEIMDEEMVIVKKDKVTIQKRDGSEVKRAEFIIELNENELGKGTYPHYMLKEIDEQPLVVRKIIDAYLNEDGKLSIDDQIIQAMNETDRIYIIACGTSYHAGLVGKQLIEKLAQVPTEVHIASEFSYNMPLLSKKPFFIFISQSGETADSRAVLVKVKALEFPTLTITNVPHSTLSREADNTLLLHAGPEIAVASTKAYTAQVTVLSILANMIAKDKGIVNLSYELAIAASTMEILCNEKKTIEQLMQQFLTASRNAFFIGRSIDYYVALEGALKLKEISYIQAEGFPGGELKHGPIALIETGTPVIALTTQTNVNASIRSNIKEVEARGANTCIISMEGLQEKGDTFVIPTVHELLTPLVSVIPLQLLAYYAALQRGCDIDKPRNLAKSVTVE